MNLGSVGESKNTLAAYDFHPWKPFFVRVVSIGFYFAWDFITENFSSSIKVYEPFHIRKLIEGFVFI